MSGGKLHCLKHNSVENRFKNVTLNRLKVSWDCTLPEPFTFLRAGRPLWMHQAMLIEVHKKPNSLSTVFGTPGSESLSFCCYCLETAVIIGRDTLQADWKLKCWDTACCMTPGTSLPTVVHSGQPCPSQVSLSSPAYLNEHTNALTIPKLLLVVPLLLPSPPEESLLFWKSGQETSHPFMDALLCVSLCARLGQSDQFQISVRWAWMMRQLLQAEVKFISRKLT